MNKVYKVIMKEYGYDEPVLTRDLKKLLDISDVALRQNLKRLSDSGALIRVRNGVYYVPREKSVLKSPRVNLEKVVTRQYIKRLNEDVIGYTTGINFANQLGLTTQTASVTTISTNETSRLASEVSFGKKVVKLKKPKAKVNERNYKVLQVLDLMSEYDRVSETPLEYAVDNVMVYLKNVNVTQKEFNQYLKKYPRKTLENLLEMGFVNEFARE